MISPERLVVNPKWKKRENPKDDLHSIFSIELAWRREFWARAELTCANDEHMYDCSRSIYNLKLAGYPRFHSIWAEQNRSEIRTITLNDSGNNGLFGWIDNAAENKNEIPNWSWLLVETNDNDK